jgi:hypothetical protein
MFQSGDARRLRSPFRPDALSFGPSGCTASLEESPPGDVEPVVLESGEWLKTVENA